MRLFNKIKRQIAFLLLFVTTAANFSGTAAYAATGGASANSEYVTLVRTGAEKLGPSFKGDEAGATTHRFTYPLAAVKDVAGSVGYCVEPFARGVSPNGQEQTFSKVPSEQLDTKDKQLLGIMMAGYPNNSYGRSAEDAYMATQIAIQHFVFQYPDKYPNAKKVKFNNDDWSHWENGPIVELAKTIYNAGIANPYVPGSGSGGVQLTATVSNGGVFTNNGETLEITISLGASESFQVGKLTLPAEIRNLVKSGKGSITVDGKAVSFKAYILGSGDSYEGIEIKPGDKVVMITLDKLSAEAYVSTPGQTKTLEYEFEVIGGDSLQAFMGNNLNSSNQDYIFMANGPAEPVSGELLLTRDTVDEPPGDYPGRGGLKILKYNKVTNTLVSGAIFEIRGVSATNWDFLVQIQASPGAAIPLPDGGTAVTGVGYIELRDIRPGQYQITEITPPPYYDYCALGVNSQVVTVIDTGDSGLFPQVRFENNPYASLKIRKIDAVTGQPVNGAILRIRNPLANFDVEMVTMNGGVIELNNLPQGNYEISEVYAPNKYIKSSEMKVATLRWGETTDITFENQPKTEILVKKIDGDTGEPLHGAYFRLTKPDTGDTWEDVTFYDGYAVFSNIPNGTYVLEETKAPEGYILDSTKQTIVIQNYKSNEIVIQNFKKPTLVILKVDEETGQPLANAEFRIAKMSGQIVYEGLTGPDGTIKLEGLSSEWYKITEIAAPKGYLIATEPKDVYFEQGQVLYVKFDNRLRPSLEILKIDEETGQPLAGAKFKVWKAEDSTVSEYVTGPDGRIIIHDLDEIIYSVEEIVAPHGYLLETQHKDILLEWGKTKTLVFTNKARPKLRILKIDVVTGKPLANAEFRVTKVEDKTVSEYITDGTGEILIENLDKAIYRVEEFMPPDGYIRYDESKEIMLEWGKTKTLKFDNIRKPVLIFLKTNALTGKGIPGATFKVEYEMPGGGLKNIGSFKTGADGRIIIPKVEPGWYVFTETLPTPGFALPSNPVTRVYVDAGQNAYLAEFDRYYTGGAGDTDTGTPTVLGALIEEHSGYEYYIEGEGFNWPLNSVVIKKAHAVTGELLAGAAFELYRADEQVSGVPGTAIGRYTTDNSGVIVITGLEPGFYVVKEVQAPQNFLISENSQQNGFLKADGTTVLEFAFANYPYGSILISKTDGLTGEPLAGARFKVTDGAGAAVGNTNGEYVTDSRGEILIPNVKPGAYVVTEIQAPANYSLITTPQTIQVGTDGKTYKVTFDNYPYASLLISKVDALTGTPLAGARFKVTDSTGAVVGNSNGEYVTDSRGEILIPNIKPGSVVVTEIQAPTNYAINTTPQTVQIGADGQTYKVVFDNYPYAEIVIRKLDSVTRAPLAGAEFKVTASDGSVVGTGNGIYRTDATGTVKIPNLPKDTYVLEEITAPTGYILENQTQTVAVDYGKSYTVDFYNKPKSSLQIIKIDSETKQPLKDARFTVYRANGEVVGTYDTDGDGLIIISGLEPGWLKIVEVKAPSGYQADDTPRDVEITYNQFLKITFENKPLASLIVKKIDDKTGAPLPGAVFRVERQDGRFVGEYTTDRDGIFTIPGIEPGWYVIREQRQPDGYMLDETPKTVEVKTVTPTVVTFANKKLTALQIIKVDEKTGEPLGGAKFTVEKQNGERVGEYTTDNTGLISIPTLDPDWYVVRETAAPQGYILDNTPKTVEVKTNAPTVVTFTNNKKSGLQIIKQDAVTGEPLAGAIFTVYKKSGDIIGEFTTDGNGVIIIDNLEPNWYKIAETKAPSGYMISEGPKDVEVTYEQFLRVVFTNERLASLQIKKVDEKTGEPLAGAKFAVEKQNGERVGEYTTDGQGIITVPTLSPGFYVVRETKAPDGFWLDESPKTVEVKTNEPTIVTFSNKRLTSLQIKKIDEVSGAPLAGAVFTIEKQNGEKVYTHENGLEWVTDAQGFINIPTLAPGFYIVREIKAPANYILDETPKTVEVKTDLPTVVTFGNKPLAGLKIVKLNSVTREPIAGVEFSISKMNGEKIDNDFRGYTFKTDNTGQIFIPNLADGYYLVTETKSADGYFLDGEPKTVLVQSGKTTLLEVFNEPMSGLLIVKTDEKTGKPLQGVVFDVRRADGQFVAGSILDSNQPNTPNNSPNRTTSPNGDITGSYTTDKNGRILINSLSPGQYHVIERKPLDGYEIDTDVHAVTVTPGKLATLQLTNRQKAGLRLLKIDAFTKAPIYGVEFMVFDAGRNVVGTYYTDDRGLIDFSGILTEGRYTIRETKPAPGYYADDMPRTIEFVSGEMTEVVWQNTPQLGQVQIIKKSGDDNEINGLPAGTPLEGAIFEIYQYKSGNMVDRFVSGPDGRAVSKPLPLGRYIIKEVQAPQWYKISAQTLDIEIEFATQIIKQEFLNYSANTGVTIRKTGNQEVMSGDVIRYDIKELRNDSTVPLTDFYWRDVLPVDAVRLTKIVTGTFNQSLKYKILVTTNKGDTKIIADNLSTTKNNVIDCSNASLGLRNDEFVTSFTVIFGTVKAGFSMVETPQIYVKVQNGLPNGYQFANKADIGGKYGREWVIGASTWLSQAYNPNTPGGKLPRTGY